MMSLLASSADVLSWALIVLGGALGITGGIGLLRFPDVYARMHAVGLTDTVTAGAILLGLLLQAETVLVAIKLVLIFAFLLIASPTANHALARAALEGGVRPRVEADSAAVDIEGARGEGPVS